MAKKLSARPKRELSSQERVDESALMDVISRGGSVAVVEDEVITKPTKEKQVTVPLRLYPSLLEKVQKVVDAKPIKTPRNTWILEAILEKLDRDKEVD